jgi:hypothetical protein
MYEKLLLEVYKQSASNLNELQIKWPKNYLYYLECKPTPYPVFTLPIIYFHLTT